VRWVLTAAALTIQATHELLGHIRPVKTKLASRLEVPPTAAEEEDAPAHHGHGDGAPQALHQGPPRPATVPHHAALLNGTPPRRASISVLFVFSHDTDARCRWPVLGFISYPPTHRPPKGRKIHGAPSF
jgi:hypothetical protein